ncbi:hypothetical protein CXB51_017224 [Gossypium anomalum]|uniref:Integrase catalytic domain-containing protein n=1 Tax=Gossypium anomalum TaxID=47600 RepID=A0A8J5YN85_9ROSI|nr:hypothetical protein CXB51_017224 [Gossypium anomalum]
MATEDVRVMKISGSRLILLLMQMKQQVLLILEGYGLHEFVLGTVSVPPQSVVDKDGYLGPNPEFLFHKQQDKLLASWLLTTIGDEILVHLTAARSSFDVWNTVVRCFASKSALTVSTLRHSLYSQKKGQLTVKEYLAKIKSLCDNLTAISIILAGLPVEFESIRIVAFAMRVPLDLLTKMLADCEARQQELVSNMSFQANFVQQCGSTDDTISKSDRGSRQAYKGNGRFFRGRGQGRKFSNIKPQCQLYGRVGHTVQPLQAHCHQFQGTSTSCAGHHCCSHKAASIDSTANFNHVPCSSNPVNPTVWYPDSGASNHVTNDLDNLQGAAPYTGNHKLYMGNGVSVLVAHVGSGLLQTTSRVFRLHNILHVPRCQDRECPIGVLLVGHIHNGLYKFDMSAFQGSKAVVPSPATAPVTNLVPLASTPFELVVADIWGPASVSSEGHSYYISFVDAYSRFTWLYLIKHKCFKLTGGEFRSFPQALSQLGIHHRLSCPHTSEQNGLVERKHRHIVDIGLMLLGQANVPMHLWAHTFITAIHLINRLPTPVLNGKSPYELLYKSVPTYMHLKVFGCRCYPYLRPFNSNKLQYHSRPCVFLGYSPVHKGYKCLDDNGKMFISRHVKFNETCFPFSAHSDSGSALHGIHPQFLHQQTHVPVLVPADRPTSLVTSTPHSASLSTPHSSPADACSNSHLVSGNTQIVEEVAAPLVNMHPMQTRAKSGIFKPHIFSVKLHDTEPITITEAFSSKEWTLAAQQEYDALMKNNTWDLVPLPANRRAAGCKWIFKLKHHSDGSIARYKGRLVVKGYLQEARIDCHETFSPVVKLATIRVVLALAVKFGWSLRQIDINNAFLNGDLTEEIYMAPRAWFSKLRDFLLTSRFVVAKSDGSLFIRKTGGLLLYVLVYVDDIIVTGNHQGSIDKFFTALDTQFSLKDLGPLSYFLGIEVLPTTNGLFLSQRKYILDLLKRAQMECVKGSPTPMTTSTRLSQHDGSAIENEFDYRSIVGALQYVLITRPDITFAVNKVCQFMHQPLDQHFKAVKRILRYLQHTVEYGLHFTTATHLDLVDFFDANWGIDDRRSTTGFCVFFCGNPVAWGSKKQLVVSRSTTEAEYRGLAHTITKIVWLESLLSELHIVPSKKATVWCDNSGAVAVSANPVLHSKFKHVELDLFFVREKVAAGQLVVGHVPAQNQVADIFTKPLSAPMFTKFHSCLKVLSKQEPTAEVK